MRRACTEDGLWDRLAAGIRPIPDRTHMVRQFLDVYRDEKRAARLAAE